MSRQIKDPKLVEYMKDIPCGIPATTGKMKTSTKWAIGLIVSNIIFLMFWIWVKYLSGVSEETKAIFTDLLVALLIMTNFQALYAFYWGYKQTEPYLWVQGEFTRFAGLLLYKLRKRNVKLDNFVEGLDRMFQFSTDFNEDLRRLVRVTVGISSKKLSQYTEDERKLLYKRLGTATRRFWGFCDRMVAMDDAEFEMLLNDAEKKSSGKRKSLRKEESEGGKEVSN